MLDQGPFVFLNACQVGTDERVLGDYGGFASTLLRIGATGVAHGDVGAADGGVGAASGGSGGNGTGCSVGSGVACGAGPTSSALTSPPQSGRADTRTGERTRSLPPQ